MLFKRKETPAEKTARAKIRDLLPSAFLRYRSGPHGESTYQVLADVPWDASTMYVDLGAPTRSSDGAWKSALQFLKDDGRL